MLDLAERGLSKTLRGRQRWFLLVLSEKTKCEHRTQEEIGQKRFKSSIMYIFVRSFNTDWLTERLIAYVYFVTGTQRWIALPNN